MKKTVKPLRKSLNKTASVTCFKIGTLAPNRLGNVWLLKSWP